MRACIQCGDDFLPARSNYVRCVLCRINRASRRNTKTCLDCNNRIGPQANRCQGCSNKNMAGAGNHNYIGKKKTVQGYVVLSDSESKTHPNAWECGEGIYEHIKVMSDFLGRPLIESEEVHHLNGIRNDNKIGNLELWTRSHPTGIRVEDMYEWAVGIVEQYREDVKRLHLSKGLP